MGFFNPVIPMVVCGIPPLVQTSNPVSRPDFALNPEPEKREIPNAEKPIDYPLQLLACLSVCFFVTKHPYTELNIGVVPDSPV